MSLRQTLSESSYFRTAVVGGLVVVVLGFVLSQTRGRGVPNTDTQTYFTVDDGKTWFADDAKKLPPFDKNGKQAVRAFVYRSTDGTVFVNHLQRFKPDAKRVLEAESKPDPNRKGPLPLTEIQSALVSGREVKRPGDTKWIASDDYRAAGQILEVKSPQGGSDAIPVDP